jgi:hypothetical protein
MKRQLWIVLGGSAALVLALSLAFPPPPVSAQGLVGPATLQTTLASGATRISSLTQQAYQVMLQNNAAHSMRCGDGNVTSTRGALLTASGGTINFSAPLYLSQLYCVGTQGDVVDVIYVH